MTCLYTPYVSPIEKKLRDRLKTARARMEGQACRRDPLRPKPAALPMPITELPKPAPVVAESWVDRQKRLWFWIEKDLGPVGPITISMIQEIVCTHYGITHNDLVCKRRTMSVVLPRQVGMYLCKILTPHSLPKIGARFGGRDHTTCLSNVRKIERLKAIDPELAQTIEALIVKIKGEDHACVTPSADRVRENLADGSKASQSSSLRNGIDPAGFNGPAVEVRKQERQKIRRS